MGEFVSKRAKVGLLISHVPPGITPEVIGVCLEAGVREIGAFKSHGYSRLRGRGDCPLQTD